MALFLKSKYTFEVLDKGNDQEIDFISIIINLNKSIKLGIVLLYKPPNINYNKLEFITDILDTITPLADELLLLGDFNININNPHQNDVHFLSDLTSAYNLSQIISCPTRNNSILDHVYATNREFVIETVIEEASKFVTENGKALTDHNLINCYIKTPKVSKLPSYKTVRNINNLDSNPDFQQFASALPWDDVLKEPNLERKVYLLNSLIINIYDSFSPEKKVKNRNKPAWLTQTIVFMIYLRNKALSDYHLNRTTAKWVYYKDLRNLVTTSIRKEKIAYSKYLESRIKNDSKAAWNGLKSFGLNKRISEIPQGIFSADDINDYFLSSSNIKMDTENKQTTIDYYMNRTFKDVDEPFSLMQISMDDMVRYITEIKTNATGSDKISLKMLILILPYCGPAVLDIINMSITNGSFPNSWKTGIILPLPKTKDPKTLKDLRPICILPAVSKVAEKAVCCQLKDYIKIQDITPKFQSGYRKRHSTSTALINVCDDITRAMDNSEGVLLVMLDFSKAFDTICPDILLAKMKYYGFAQKTINWFSAYLHDRKQIVQITTEGKLDRSETKLVMSGVPQGSTLGPILFILYTADLCNILESVNVQCYADDYQLYKHFNISNVNECVETLTRNVASISSYSESQSLKLNVSKTKAILFGTKYWCNTVENLVKLQIGSTEVHLEKSVHNLGLLMDVNLNFTAHVNSVCQKCYYVLYNLYKFRDVFPNNLKLKLCESLVLPIIDYCLIVYGSYLTNIDLQKLQKIQNNCVRYSLNIARREHITPFLCKIGWLKIEYRFRYLLTVEIHNILLTKLPTYLYEKILWRNNIHNVNTRNSHKIEIFKHNTEKFKASFSYLASKLYNDVPDSFKTCSISTFKNKLKLMYLNNQKNALNNNN